MRYKIIDDMVYVEKIRQSLNLNGGYCPCVRDSKGKEEYLCVCKDFRENVPVGEKCHCGIYVKLPDNNW